MPLHGACRSDKGRESCGRCDPWLLVKSAPILRRNRNAEQPFAANRLLDAANLTQAVFRMGAMSPAATVSVSALLAAALAATVDAADLPAPANLGDGLPVASPARA